MNVDWGDKPIRWPLAFMFGTGVIWFFAAVLGFLLGNGGGKILNTIAFGAFLALWMLPYVALRYHDGAWPARAVDYLRGATVRRRS